MWKYCMILAGMKWLYFISNIELKFSAVSKPLVTVTATVTVRSANFRSASISLKSASIREDQLQY